MITVHELYTHLFRQRDRLEDILSDLSLARAGINEISAEFEPVEEIFARAYPELDALPLDIMTEAALSSGTMKVNYSAMRSELEQDNVRLTRRIADFEKMRWTESVGQEQLKAQQDVLDDLDRQIKKTMEDEDREKRAFARLSEVLEPIQDFKAEYGIDINNKNFEFFRQLSFFKWVCDKDWRAGYLAVGRYYDRLGYAAPVARSLDELKQAYVDSQKQILECTKISTQLAAAQSKARQTMEDLAANLETLRQMRREIKSKQDMHSHICKSFSLALGYEVVIRHLGMKIPAEKVDPLAQAFIRKEAMEQMDRDLNRVVQSVSDDKTKIDEKMLVVARHVLNDYSAVVNFDLEQSELRIDYLSTQIDEMLLSIGKRSEACRHVPASKPQSSREASASQGGGLFYDPFLAIGTDHSLLDNKNEHVPVSGLDLGALDTITFSGNGGNFGGGGASGNWSSDSSSSGSHSYGGGGDGGGSSDGGGGCDISSAIQADPVFSRHGRRRHDLRLG